MSSNRHSIYLLFLVLLVVAVIILTLFSFPDKNLHIIACDVGQGDAILVIHEKTQILFDGGPGRKVLDCLGRHMPFWDRHIEVVIITHPEKDHYGGIIDVVENYNVGTILTSGFDSISPEWGVLEQEVGGKGIRVVQAKSGQMIGKGLMQLDIVYPDTQIIGQEVSKFSSIKQSNESNVLGSFTGGESLNNLSLVVILKFGEFEALLTGDIEDTASDKVAEILKERKIDFEYIKVPHHGSKNGLSQNLLDAIHAEISTISSGKNNSYGHPHDEVLKMLNNEKIYILRTDQIGDIEVVTDGNSYRIED